MVEQVFDDAKYFAPIFEMRGKPVDIDDEVDERYPGQNIERQFVLFIRLKGEELVNLRTGLSAYFHPDLASYDFTEFAEDLLSRFALAFLMFDLDNFQNAVKILCEAFLQSGELSIAYRADPPILLG